MSKVTKTTLVTSLLILGIGIGMEINYRNQATDLYNYLPISPTIFHETYGRISTPDFQLTDNNRTDNCNQKYAVQSTTDSEGFRYFGRLNNPDDKRLLVIGNGYTQAIQISNDQTYYGRLKDSLDRYHVELFVYGADGFGPKYQYEWLKKWYPTIEPDAILWQFSSDDLLDFYPDVERHPLNSPRPVPYGSHVVARGMNFIKGSPDPISLSNDPTAYQNALNELDKTLNQSKALMDEGMAVVAFSADDSNKYTDDMTAVFEKNGITVYENVPVAIRNFSTNVKNCRTYGNNTFWNEDLHAVAEKMIFPKLKPVVKYPDSLLYKYAKRH